MIPHRESNPLASAARALACTVIVACIIAGCAPAPKYRAHERSSDGGTSSLQADIDSTGVPPIVLVSPVENLTEKRITSLFGRRGDGSNTGSRVHQGIDIKARPGESVCAAAAGTVVFAGRQHGYGNVVILDHGSGLTTVYAHLFYASVRRGEEVGAGETVGRAGKRGTATGTHLHFELKYRSEPLDPMRYLRPCLRAT